MAVRPAVWLLFAALCVRESLQVDLHLRKFYDDSGPRNYRDYKLIRITPRNEDNLKYLRDLEGVQSPYELDFWQSPSHIGAVVDVTVSPDDAEIFVRDLDSKQLDYIVAINDLEQAIRSEKSVDTPSVYQLNEGFQLDKYNTWPVIEDYLYELQRQHPDLVSLTEIGRTHENRSLIVVKLSGKHQIGEKKVAMWMDAGIHAREWIAPATALNIIDRLVNMYHSDATVQKLMDGIDFYILPVMNPDGYVHTHTKNRMWRKNRRPAVCRSNHLQTLCCAGVDLNRNFDWFWAASGSSSDPCHETFHGPSAFSEPESRAVKTFLEQNPVKGFISFHSYSQLWLIPYGHRRRSYPQDYSTALRPLALRATEALHKLYGTKYAVGTGADLMYEASGASHDYAKGTLHIPYAYLVELRPKSTKFANGFLLPEREILETSEETFEAVKVVADELLGQFARPVGPTPKGRPSRRPSPYRTISTLVPYQSTHTDPPSTTTSAPPTTSTSAPTTPTTTTQATSTTTETTTTTTTETPTTVVTEQSTTEESSTSGVTNRVVRCKDYGSYCKWWKIHGLCHNERVLKLCALSCLPECQI